MNVLIGTSGYAQPDWVGPFYPAGTTAEAMLSYYSREFPTVELDWTYQAMPTAIDLAALVGQVPAGFKFAVRLYQGLTRSDDPAGLIAFRDALSPLIQAAQLACVLADMPAAFEDSPANRDHLLRLRDGLPGASLAVAFGNKGWIVEGVEGWLRQQGLCFCCADQPRLEGLVQPIGWVTGPVAYLRFLGRNYDAWLRTQEPSERYDYAYDLMDLAEWLPKIEDCAAQASLVLIYMANFPRGQAIQSARLLRQLVQVG